MKKFLCFLLFLAILMPTVLAANGDTLVYITRTGECYHMDGCSYLRSRIEVSLQEAVDRGYRACSRCGPPRLTSSYPSSGEKNLTYYLNKTKDSESNYSSYSSPDSSSSKGLDYYTNESSRQNNSFIDRVNFSYVGFLVLVIIFFVASGKNNDKTERRVSDAFRRGFLAALDMDNNKIPRSNIGTEKHPANDSQIRINRFWGAHNRHSYFKWDETDLYNHAYSEGFRMGKNSAETAADQEFLDLVNDYRKLKADYDYLQRKYLILTSDDFDDEFD